MMRQQIVWPVVLIVVSCVSVSSAQIFMDDLSSGTNWTITQDPDSSFQFGYDYSQDGLPPAPNGNDTIGLKLEVNNNAPADVNQIGAFNENEAYTGQFTFRVDIWSNWAPDGGTIGTGTTEFVGVSVGHDAFLPGPFGGSFIYTGDGDAAATDYRLYKDDTQLQAESGQYALGNEAGARDSSNPVLMNAFPSINIAEAVPTQGSSGTVAAGAAGFQWMTVNVEVDTDAIGPSGATTEPGFARISMRSDTSGNTVEIGTIDNSNGEFPANLEGSIGILMSDLFSSVTVNPAFSFAIFDNVQVLEGLVDLTTENGITGDFNDDGFVNAADYTVWRNTLGQSGSDLAADGDNSGEIDDNDYFVWKSNFGVSAGVGAWQSAAVPEPPSMLLTLMALFTLGAICTHRTMA